MHILIAGAGGVGGVFGAKLARAGETVTLLARGAHLEAIRRDGLTVRSAVEGEFVVRPRAVADVAGLPPVDAVLFCVKSFDTDGAAEALRPAVGRKTPVLSLQNGVDNEDRLDAILGAGHALGGVAQVFAGIERPGVIAHHFAGRIIFGELDGRRTPRAERLLRAFEAAGIAAELTAYVRCALWEKYVLICGVAGMTALTRCPIGVVRDTPETWAMFRRLVEEVAAVGAAAGVDLPADVVERTLKLAAGIAPGNRASLAQDLEHGRRLELEALHGHAVRLGARLGVPVPTVAAVYAALLPHVAGRRG